MYGGQPKEKKEQVNVLFPSSLAKQKSPIQKKREKWLLLLMSSALPSSSQCFDDEVIPRR